MNAAVRVLLLGLPLAVLAGLPVGCSLDRLIYQTALPETRTPATLEVLAQRGDYTDVRVETAGERLRFLLPGRPEAFGEAAEACRILLETQGPLYYRNAGVLGTLERAGVRCEPVGILSLAEWRDRQPRGSREPVPRSRASFSLVQRDADTIFVRGRFGLAGELGWAGGADSIAVLPAIEACDAVVSQGVASLEYRHAGPRPLVLLGPQGPCPLLGLARPAGG